MLYLIFRAEPETRVAFGGSDAEKGQTMRAAVRHQLDPTIRSNDTRDFHASLRAKIVGQEEGIQFLVDMYQVTCAGFNSPGSHVADILFLASTGSGKTCIAETEAEILSEDARAVSKEDSASIKFSHVSI